MPEENISTWASSMKDEELVPKTQMTQSHQCGCGSALFMHIFPKALISKTSRKQSAHLQVMRQIYLLSTTLKKIRTSKERFTQVASTPLICIWWSLEKQRGNTDWCPDPVFPISYLDWRILARSVYPPLACSTAHNVFTAHADCLTSSVQLRLWHNMQFFHTRTCLSLFGPCTFQSESVGESVSTWAWTLCTCTPPYCHRLY